MAACLLSALIAAASSVHGSALMPNGPHPDQSSQREVLLNGLPVVTRKLAGDRVAVVLAIRAGAMFDPSGRSGLASLTARLLAEGGGSFDDARIRAEIEGAGASMSIITDWDATWIVAEAPTEGLTTLLDVISLMVSAPRFDQKDFDEVKREHLERAKARSLDADAVADLELARALFGKHTYGRSVEGDMTSIEAIRLGDVKAFWEKFYVANGGALAMAGPVELESVMRLVKPRFGRWSMGKLVPATFLAPQPLTPAKVVLVDAPALAEARVRVGFVGPKRSDAASQIASTLRRATESHLQYSGAKVGTFEVGYSPRALVSPFVISAVAPVASATESLRIIVGETGRLGTGEVPPPPPPPAVGGPAPASERSAVSELARAAAAETFFAAQGIAAPAKGYRHSSEVTEAARTIFRSSAMAVVVVGPAAQLEPALKQAGYTVEVVRR